MSSDIVQLEVKLIERFLSKRDQMIAEAQKKAEEIVQQARERGEKAVSEGRQDQMRITGTDLKAVRDKILGQSEQDGRRKIMALRETEISRVFSQVENKLEAIAEGKDKSKDYHEILVRLITEAASAIGEKELVVAANKKDQKYLSKELEQLEKKLGEALGYNVRLILAEEPIKSIGGVILYDGSKKKTFYNTFESRVQKARAVMAPQVAKVLKVI